MLLQRIEGYRISRLAWGTASAQPITVGFWMTAPVVGTYFVYAANFNGTSVTSRQSVITTTTGWQWITATIPAQTTGTWKADNSVGMELRFELASSSTPHWLGTAGTTMAITGLVVLPGIEAPSAARSSLIMRPYDQELMTCKRYFQLADAGMGLAYSTTAIQFTVRHPGMRIAPTVKNPGNVQVTDTGSAFTQSTPSGVLLSANSANSGLYNLGNFTGVVNLRAYLTVPNSSAPLTADARL